jgi:hypothetical protein
VADIGPGQRAWAAPLLCDRGGRRGAGDAALRGNRARWVAMGCGRE